LERAASDLGSCVYELTSGDCATLIVTSTETWSATLTDCRLIDDDAYDDWNVIVVYDSSSSCDGGCDCDF